jgi:hypothetical protein
LREEIEAMKADDNSNKPQEAKRQEYNHKEKEPEGWKVGLTCIIFSLSLFFAGGYPLPKMRAKSVEKLDAETTLDSQSTAEVEGGKRGRRGGGGGLENLGVGNGSFF